MTLKADPKAYPPRGMNREDAAHYVGVGVTLFDEMVADKRMPKPKRINGRTVWDRAALDIAFSDLPGGEPNYFDEALQRGGRTR